MILVIATADFFVVLRLRMGIGVVAAAVVALMQLATTMMLQEGLVVKVEMVVAHVADVVVAVVMVPAWSKHTHNFEVVIMQPKRITIYLNTNLPVYKKLSDDGAVLENVYRFTNKTLTQKWGT